MASSSSSNDLETTPIKSNPTEVISVNSETQPLKANLNIRVSLRSSVAYWFLGLCNNFGYVVMLSAAHDVLSKNFNNSNNEEIQDIFTNASNSSRDCNKMSTGAILLADILPSLVIKFTAPFLPLFMQARVSIVVGLSSAGFLLVAMASAHWIVILGVILTSLASGLGELTFLAYTKGFHTNIISMWSSGTGGAGVFGAGSYAGLTALGISPSHTLLIMLVIPVTMCFSFWGLLEKPGETTPEDPSNINDTLSIHPERVQVMSLGEKIRSIPSLFVYMIPLCAVYFLEYFINQGLFELIYFPNIWINHKEQYRWFQVVYQIGVFISRSSAGIIQFKKIWLMAVLQAVNVILFVIEALYFLSPSIWIIFILILWEGLLGGAAYVNTFHRVSCEIPEDRKEFSMSITTIADAIGIALAGVVAIPVHNAICELPMTV